MTKESLKEGLFWRAPWNDVFVYDTRYKSFKEKVDALTADDLPVTVFGIDSPALLWSLRNHNPTVVLALDPASAPELIVTPPQDNLGLASAYRGQDFNWRQTPIWDSFSSFSLRWLTYRELPSSSETIVLWVRNDLFIDSEQP